MFLPIAAFVGSGLVIVGYINVIHLLDKRYDRYVRNLSAGGFGFYLAFVNSDCPKDLAAREKKVFVPCVWVMGLSLVAAFLMNFLG